MTPLEFLSIRIKKSGDGLDDFPQGPGVYAVINRLTGRVYVGSAKRIYARCRGHINGLKRGETYSSLMRRDLVLNGAEHFTCVVLQVFDSIDQAGGMKGLGEFENDWIYRLGAYQESVGYNAKIFGVWTKAASLRDRERKLLRRSNYALLDGVDLDDPIDDELAASWIPTPRRCGAYDRWPWMANDR